MANKLIIKQLGGGELGSVTQTAGGSLVVQAVVAAHQADLEKLVLHFGQKALPYTMGETEVKEGQTIQKTIVRSISPGHPDYLRALAGALSQREAMFQGKRVRAYVVNA